MFNDKKTIFDKPQGRGKGHFTTEFNRHPIALPSDNIVKGSTMCGLCGTINRPSNSLFSTLSSHDFILFDFLGRKGVKGCCDAVLDQLFDEWGFWFADKYLYLASHRKTIDEDRLYWLLKMIDIFFIELIYTGNQFDKRSKMVELAKKALVIVKQMIELAGESEKIKKAKSV